MDTIPVEILAQIIKELEPTARTDDGLCIEYDPSSLNDITNVRLVCKAFRDAAREPFGITLGARRFRFFPASIQDLEDLSKNQHIAPYITTFSFGIEHFYLMRSSTLIIPDWYHKLDLLLHADYASERVSGRPARHVWVKTPRTKVTKEERNRLRSMYDAYEKFHYEQNQRETTIDCIATMERALRRLPNLRTIRLCNGVSPHLVRWPGCNEGPLLQRLGITLDQLYGQSDSRSRMNVVHKALEGARLQPKVLIQGSDGEGTDVMSFYESGNREFQPTMSKLQVLWLRVKFPSRPHPLIPNPDLWTGRLPWYIMSAPYLRELSLSFGPDKLVDIWPPLDVQEQFGEVSRHVRLQELEFLQLGFMELEETHLTKFLCAHKNTLQSLTLRSICLREGGSWASVLAQLRDHLSLNYLEVHDLEVGDGSDGMADIDGELFGQAATTTIMRGEAEYIQYEGPRLA